MNHSTRPALLTSAMRGAATGFVLLCVLLGLTPATAHATQAERDMVGPPPVPATTRIATIGASVTAGYGNAAELRTKADVPLSVYLKALLPDGRETVVTGKGDNWFFRAARRRGKRQVDRALETSPTLVIGVDFLFWYAFGHASNSDPRRARGLEVGLDELDRIACPLVIGDLPDVASALHGKGPFGRPMITRSMLPRESERVAMNARIRAWAEARGDVAIVPLSVMTSRMLQGSPMTVRGTKWTVRDPLDALQPDLLHPTSRGMIWIARSAADAASRLEGVDEDAFVWDEAIIQARIDEVLEASRRGRARKEKEREARREKTDREREKNDRVPLHL